MDVIVDIGGDAILFELKDKEFSLRDAYSLGAKINLIRADRAVIVTSDRVGNDVREHFKRAQTSGQRNRSAWAEDYDAVDVISYIEGLGNLRVGIEKIITEISVSRARTILRTVLPLASIDSVTLLSAWQKRDITAGSVTPYARKAPKSAK